MQSCSGQFLCMNGQRVASSSHRFCYSCAAELQLGVVQIVNAHAKL